MLLVSDVFVLIDYYGQILWLSVAASIGGMLWLRHKQPDMSRPIKVNMAIPVIFLFCCAFLVIFPIPKQPMNTVIGAAITLSGVPVYYLFVKRKNKPVKFNRAIEWLTEILQSIMVVISPETEQMLSSS
jgi:L-type amino acid transporter 5